MNASQLSKILKVFIICALILVFSEGIMSIPEVNCTINDFVLNSGKYIWIVIWLLMFLQVWLIPIPAYVLLMSANTLNLPFGTIFFVTLSAYTAGCLVAYVLGYKYGRLAVKWTAGSDETAEEWSTLLRKNGKIWYIITILLPVFPDDILAIMAGAIKMDFAFYLISNILGRGIGLVSMMMFLDVIPKGNGTLIFLSIITIVLIISKVVVDVKRKKEVRNAIEKR